MNKILQYFESIQSLILSLPDIVIERYTEQILTKDRGNLRIKLRFHDNSLLELSEAIHFGQNTCKYLSYRYHYQKADGSIIFRYDNCPHHPEIATYPEHKHAGNSIISDRRPSIEQILLEIKKQWRT